MFSDLRFIILWWLVILLVGFVSFPLTTKVFSKFYDRGYIFSKIISLGLATYLIFVLGVFKILPFTVLSIVLTLLALAVFNYRYFPTWLKTLKEKYPVFIFEEAIFLLILTAWSFVRAYAPDIEGLEKYMDWGFINSILRTRFMPPADMWFTPLPINYYYFGHLVFAFLTKLSNISSAITYNLAIATVCALTFVSGFSLVSNLTFSIFKKAKIGPILLSGLLAALFLTFGGNLHTVYKVAKINIQKNGHLLLTKDALVSASQAYWYPDATRFIGFDPDINDKTIHEFPLYSFVVADLHGHMNDIPVVIFFVAFLFASYLLPLSKSLFNWFLIIPSALTLSIAYMTNAWDFAVYGLLFAISHLLVSLSKTSFQSAILKTFANGITIIVLWYLFTLPFSLNFTPMAEGLRLSDTHSAFYQLFVLYGGFWLICLPFVAFFRKFKLITADYFVLSLIITATILIILPEIGYLKDIYIYEHRRANTMFKLVYQAFMMYSLATGYVLVRLSKIKLYKLLFLIVFSCHLIYPYFAVKSYYGLKEYRGLWGLEYLKNLYPDNLAAIDWLNSNVTGQPVILEASGDSYTTYNQVSVATGLPTVEGWVVHEWLWRGGYDLPGARATEVQNMYQSQNVDELRQLLQKYNVQYVFVGAKEIEKYPDLDTKNFETLGAKIVFQSGQTKIYKL
ncbi:hypothetical protein A3K55_02055 [Candidatus Shapirobacteria bacterium RBG_13_44_7]|uniref:YYY membrane protein n=1 Tax=Candidatus Shapirobacteria bacterium RBG_13_44_7 TaxID=1802149 RepID=A0A1F7SHP3_9BACT|nr:MAG: hypothetical protein A3K55_02055 [Candidatus Shapirobacteria bacterium RBG_13_44_7]